MIKKLIPITLALAAMFCTLPLLGENPPEKQKEIPIRQIVTKPIVRDLSCMPIRAYYDGMSSVIYTSFLSDLGIVEMTVTNLSTGEIWSGEFNSSITMQTALSVSGNLGCYTIVYVSESGDIYEGLLLLEY